jgi:hypothetical protein
MTKFSPEPTPIRIRAEIIFRCPTIAQPPPNLKGEDAGADAAAPSLPQSQPVDA